MNQRNKSDADVEMVIRAIPHPFQIPDLIQRTHDWNTNDYIYALRVLERSSHMENRDALVKEYQKLLFARRDEEGIELSEANSQDRQTELLDSLEELKRTHWSTAPNFWMTVVILILTAISAAAAIMPFFADN